MLIRELTADIITGGEHISPASLKGQEEVLPTAKLEQRRYKEGLSVYLNDGNAALSNNICERVIRSFTIGRKNWLFPASPKGATASVAVYSVAETCKANDIDPF